MMQRVDITVRDMNENDVKAVAAIEKECFSVPWSEKAFEDELVLEGAYTLVAEKDNKVVAFINGRMSLDEFYINNVAVTHSERHQRIATCLLKSLHERIEETAQFSTLEVRESNIAAISLYTQCGYEKAGLRKNFYEKPTENAILMTKYFKR